jgi:mannitol/fructose-specific phosphotransferase system IIA component (Ntr-type)
MDNEFLKISEVIKPETVALEMNDVTCKAQAINRLAGMLYQAGHLTDLDAYIKSVYEREQLGPTYMGNFIAIPHGKCDAVKAAGVAFGLSKNSFQYETELGEGPVKLVFLLAIPNQMSADAYVAVLARLARLLVHEEFCLNLYNASSYQDVFNAILTGEKLLEDLSNSIS